MIDHQDDIRLCTVCRRRQLAADEPATCVFCLGRARSNLIGLVHAYALLDDELLNRGGTSFEPIPTGGGGEQRIPGGEALVLLAGGAVRPSEAAEPADGPIPPVALLAAWEDDIRRVRRLPAAGRATLDTVASFIGAQLGWAAQNYELFADLADDLRKTRQRLEAVTGSGDPVDRGGHIPCPTCDTPIVRLYDDRTGRTDHWTCPSRACGRTVTDREYGFAVWAYLLDERKDGDAS